VPPGVACSPVARLDANASLRAGREGGGGGDQSALLARAETAEKEVSNLRIEVRRLEGQVRKLRSDAYFQRIQKAPRAADHEARDGDSVAGVHDEQDLYAEAAVSRAIAEERALNAETEMLRLHAELQAARTQFALLSEQTSSSTPPADYVKLDAIDYAVLPCLKYVCKCMYFLVVRVFIAACFCIRLGRPHGKGADLENPHDRIPDPPIKAFCADGAQGRQARTS